MTWPGLSPSAAGIRKPISQRPYSFPVAPTMGRGCYWGRFLNICGSQCPVKGQRTEDRGLTDPWQKWTPQERPPPAAARGTGLSGLQPHPKIVRHAISPRGLINPILQASLHQKAYSPFFPGKKKRCHSLIRSPSGSPAPQVEHTLFC